MELLPCSEVMLFKCCMAWTKAKSRQNVLSKTTVIEHLGASYYEIRFASLEIQEFCRLAAEYNLVLQSDFITITNMIALNDFEPENFEKHPRQVGFNKEAALKCSFKNKEINGNGKRYQKSKPCTTFSTNEPLLLGAFTSGKIEFVGRTIRDMRSSLMVDVTIIEIGDVNNLNIIASDRILLKMKANLQSTDTEILLPKALLVLPGLYYRSEIVIPAGHIFVSQPFNTNIQLESGIVIKIHDTIVVAGETVGLIWSLEFNKMQIYDFEKMK